MAVTFVSLSFSAAALRCRSLSRLERLGRGARGAGEGVGAAGAPSAAWFSLPGTGRLFFTRTRSYFSALFFHSRALSM